MSLEFSRTPVFKYQINEDTIFLSYKTKKGYKKASKEKMIIKDINDKTLKLEYIKRGERVKLHTYKRHEKLDLKQIIDKVQN